MAVAKAAAPTPRVEVKGQSAVKRTPAKKKPEEDHGDELGRLKRLGFSTLAEVLMSIPKAYYDYTTPVTVIGREHMEKSLYLVVRMVGDPTMFDEDNNKTSYPQSARRLEIPCKDAAGRALKVSVFGPVWSWQDIEKGEPLHVYGQLTTFRGDLQLRAPHRVLPESRGRVVAQYAGKQGQVSGDALRKGVGRAIERIEDAEVLLLAQAGLLDTEFTEMTGIKSAQTLLRLLHFPRDAAQGQRAMAVARKMSAETVARRAADARTRRSVPGSAITISKGLVEELIAEMPFPLTGDQRTAINEIVYDLRSGFPMRRLLSGDVGTGKSITFQIPAAAAFDAGASVAILVPSQLLVAQMAKELRTLFPGLPVCEIVGGSKIEGEGICVGTTALFSAAKKAKKKFDLVIVDEQHKFSVEQKLTLVGKTTNLIEATATAIPRSLALVNFGGMDVSVLRECPVKKEIRTFIVAPHQRQQSDKLIQDFVTRGGQVAVIYPLVDEDGSPKKEGKKELESVVVAAATWEKRFPGRVAVLHGKLTPEEKDAVIAGMNAKQFDILVSSLVIEVGVTLPSLKAIVINHPERFGLAQLHQLRGRVVRKGGRGCMLLLADDGMEEDAYERLETLVQCNDGFKLAEADMDARGFGDVSDDSGSQTGMARTLFYNAQLSHREIADAASRLGLKV
ncbi:DEAD/DEAH box helicase [Roseateles asaccharophilus]|uniref:DEAD/DEAH box helicase n=1 Tax=Roseateles asaccharophilus TaxID=582607 RepID=UPI00384B6645